MIIPRVFQTNFRPMPLEVTDQEFMIEFYQCWKGRDKGYSAEQLLEWLQPFFVHWENLLTNPDYPKDLHWVGLRNKLTYYGDPKEKMQAWVDRANRCSGIIHELRYLFLKYLSTCRFPYPEEEHYRKIQWKRIVTGYIGTGWVTRGFNSSLKDAMRFAKLDNLVFPGEEFIEQNHFEEPFVPDYLEQMNLWDTPWEQYWARLMHLNLKTNRDFQYYTGIATSPEVTQTKKEIWHKLSQSV